MISEKAFTEQDQNLLASTPLTVEMAVISEWIVREERNPDHLLTVYVAPTTDGSIQAACSCLRGAADLTCPHALAVINRINADGELLDKLFAQLFDHKNAGRRQNDHLVNSLFGHRSF
jgi:hypothetical protein